MAYVVPDSIINLYGGVHITNKQQIAFKTRSQQTTYFASKLIRSKVACSYVRRTGRLKIEDGVGLMLSCNYISFRNPSFEDKEIYARVVDVNYVNNTTVEISYIIDWFQTFMFDVTYEDAVMQREHLSVADWNKVQTNPYDRTVYEMFTPENLPVGKDMEKLYTIPNGVDNYLCLQPNQPMNDQDTAYTTLFDDTYSKFKDIVFMISDFDFMEISQQELTEFWNCFDTIYTSAGWKAYKSSGTFFVSSADHRLLGEDDGQGYPVYLNTPVPIAYNICFLTYNSETPETCMGNVQKVIDFLTLHQLTHCIIGLYQVSTNFKVFILNNGGFNYKVAPVNDVNVVNKKLMHSPYQYIRVETASGDIKEYHYEKFLVRNQDGTFNLRVLGTINGQPCMMILPYYYKNGSYKGDSGSNIWSLFNLSSMLGYNIAERLEFNSFSQIGFVTDAYLAYLGEQYTQNLQNRTTGSEYYARAYSDKGVLDAYGERIGGVISGGLAGAKAGFTSGGPVGAVVGAIGGVFTGGVSGNLKYGSTTQANENLNQMYDEANVLGALGVKDAQAIASGDVPSAVFNEAKAGFVADEYHPSNANSSNLYISEFGDVESFKITRVQLRDVFVQKYDSYFTRYGYSSSRVGIPRICNFMANSSDNTLLPKFLTQTNGLSMTYVKTQDMNVNTPLKPVEDFIESMFNNGMRFIDGSTL